MLLDNKVQGKVISELKKVIQPTSKLAVLSGFFSIYGFSALKKELSNLRDFRLMFSRWDDTSLHTLAGTPQEVCLSVDQNGKRVHGFDVNTLTVMVNESYEDFVKGLQEEIEKEEGIKFGIIEDHCFANIVIGQENGKTVFLGAEASKNIWDSLLESEYIDKNGKVTDELKKDMKEGNVSLPEQFEKQRGAIIARLKKVTGGINIKNNADKHPVRLNKDVFDSPEFKELWNRIKYKTVYEVDFKPDELIDKCAESIKKGLNVSTLKSNTTHAKTEIGEAGVSVTDIRESIQKFDVLDYQIPDILSCLQNETKLKRKSIVDILRKSERLKDIKKNPQSFMDGVKKLIKSEMSSFIVNGIKYKKMGDEFFYKQERFESEELIGYLHKNMIEAKKSVYEYVVYDSNVESDFAQSCEKRVGVKVYAKLPSWFKIDTPLGSYNPDWAVLFEKDGQEKLYFVVETKGSVFEQDFRGSEKDKIHCAEKHFKALGENARYMVVKNFKSFYDKAME